MSQKKKIVKFTTFNDDPNIEYYLKRLTPYLSGIWGEYQFVFDNSVDVCDFWVVFEMLPDSETVICPPENTIFVAGEGSSMKRYRPQFLKQFSHVITCQKRIKHESVCYKSPGHGWFPLKSYDELVGENYIEKNKLLSIVVSNKNSTSGHRKRLEFCLNVKEEFGDGVDLYGRGFQGFDDKWDVLAPYKYSIAIENSIENDWITEKLGDCFVTHTFPFYAGASNVSSYYDSESYQVIDVDDVQKSIKTISKIINNENHYKEHLQNLIQAKNTFLDVHCIFPMLAKFMNGLDVQYKYTYVSLEKEKSSLGAFGYSHVNNFLSACARMFK